MVFVIYVFVEDMVISVIKCVVLDVCYSYVIDRVGFVLMDVDCIGWGSIVIVCS